MATVVNLNIGGDGGGEGQVYTANLILTSPYTEPAGNLLVLRSRPDIEPLTGEWVSVTPDCIGQFNAVAGYRISSTLETTLAPLTASFTLSGGGSRATLSATLASVTGQFESTVPQQGYLTATLADATGQFNGAQVYDVSGTLDATLETVYGGFTTSSDLKYCLLDLTLPDLEMVGYTGADGQMVLDGLTLEATGNDFDNARIRLSLPIPEMTGYGGASGQAEIPSLEIAAAATQLGLITAALQIDAPLLVAHGWVSSPSEIALTLPVLELTGQTGAYASLELLAPELAMVGNSAALARIDLTLPFLEMTATVVAGATATVTLEWPAPTLLITGATGATGAISLTLPALLLSTTSSYSAPTATLPTTPPPGTQYETNGNTTTIRQIVESTYAVNLTTGAVTTLLLGQFAKLVTAHGRLYGLTTDGELVKLDGATDQGVAIPATIRFAPQQFGTLQAKRISDVYLNAREDDGMTLTLIQDETTAWTYRTSTDRATALGTHKVKVGRGVTFHSAGLLIQNRNGGRLDVGGLELLVQPLSRKPR